MGEVAATDTAITVKCLLPDSFYSIHVVATNADKFHATSEPVCIKTQQSPSPAILQNGPSAAQKQDVSKQQPDTPPKPSVVPYRGNHETLTSPLASPLLAKDQSGSLSTPPRRDSARRLSPSAIHESSDRRVSDSGPPSSSSRSIIQELTDRLGALRREADELEQQDQADEEQYKADRDALLARRDMLRNRLKEKDEESKDLNKNVTVLQRQSTAAQNQKKNHERMLQIKRNERQKIQDDKERWQRETVQMGEEIETMNKQKEQLEASISERIEQIVTARQEDQQAIKHMEEQIRETGKHVKELEEEQKSLGGDSESTAPAEWRRKAAEEDHEWSEKFKELQRRQQKAYVECFQAQSHLQIMQNRFEELSTQRRSGQVPFYPPSLSTENFPNPSDPLYESPKIGSRFQGGFAGSYPSLIGGEAWPAHTSYMLSRNAPSFNASDSDTASLFSASKMQPVSGLQEPASPGDVDRLTGGAMTSPSAGGLLPSGLLGDEAEEPSFHRPHSSVTFADSESRPSSIMQPNPSETDIVKPLPGLGTLSGATSSQAVNSIGPGSPTLRDSRPTSLTSSPHDSISGLHHHKLSDGTVDSDRRSLASTGSSHRAPRRSRMFSDMIFGNRQRGKSTPDEPPFLGSLRSNQTQSLPRSSDLHVSDHDPTAPESRRGISGGILGSMSNAVLGSRMGNSGGFASRVNPWSRAPMDSSPPARPSSVYSAENALPRPSTDSQPFGWNEGLGRSNTTRTGRQMASAWSVTPSRRQSVQAESKGTPLEDISQLDEDAQLLPVPSPAIPQPPIGTKSRIKKSSGPTPLNPNARDFRSMFSRGDKRADKDKDKEKDRPDSKSKKKDKSSSSGRDHSPPQTPLITTTLSDASPPDHLNMHSHSEKEDARSSTADSSLDDEHRSTYTSSSAGPSTPLEATISGSGAPTPTSATRDSFMKKLTRKGSSSKFSLPGLKTRTREKAPSSIATGSSAKGDITGDDTDEDVATPGGRSAAGIGSGLVGSVTSSPQILGTPNMSAHENDKDRPERDSKDGGPSSSTSAGTGKRSSGFSLSSFKRRAKKGWEEKRDPPSISETSMTSEATGEIGEEQAQGLGILERGGDE